MGSYKRNRFVGIRIGDKVNLKRFCNGKYIMQPSCVTNVYDTTFSINNGIMTFSKDSGRAIRGNEIVTHFI